VTGDREGVAAAIAEGADINDLIKGQLPICLGIANGYAIRLLHYEPDLSLEPLSSVSDAAHDVKDALRPQIHPSFLAGLRRRISGYFYTSTDDALPKSQRSYPGTEIIRSFIRSRYKSESLLLHLLDMGLFSIDYIAAATRAKEVLITDLWAICNRNGYATAVRRLIQVGFPVDLDFDFDYVEFDDDEDSEYPYQRSSVTGLLLAISMCHERTVEVLLDHGAAANGIATEPFDPKACPLLACLERGTSMFSEEASNKREIAEYLLKAGANPNVISSTDKTALATVVFACTQLVLMLLRYGADPSVVNESGQNLAHLAARRSSRHAIPILEAIAWYKKDFNFNTPDADGFTPFLLACRSHHVAVIELLLALDVDEMTKTNDGSNALQLAVPNGDISLISFLLGSPMDVNCNDKGSATALMKACARLNNRLGMVSLLLATGADPAIKDKHGRTAVHVACDQKTRPPGEQVETLEVLLESGADVNATYFDVKHHTEYVSALGSVATAHFDDGLRTKIAQTLLNAGADPNGKGIHGNPVLSEFCSLPIKTITTMEGLECKHPNPVTLLLDHGAHLFATGERGQYSFHHAAQAGNIHAMETLFSRILSGEGEGAIADASNLRDDLGRTALHIVCSNRSWWTSAQHDTKWVQNLDSGMGDIMQWHDIVVSEKFLELLQSAGADLHIKDCFGATALHIAAKAGNPRIVAALLLWTRTSPLYSQLDMCDRLAFHYAVHSAPVTEMLLRYHGYGTVERDHYFHTFDPETSLQRYETRKRPRTPPHGEEVFAPSKRRCSGIDSDRCQLQDSPRPRVSVNDCDKFGNTPLHYAALVGNLDAVNSYLQIPEIDTSIVNNDGESALDFAVDHLDCVIAIAEKAPGFRRTRRAGAQINLDHQRVERKQRLLSKSLKTIENGVEYI
jgi:ankyrin repeat protein